MRDAMEPREELMGFQFGPAFPYINNRVLASSKAEVTTMANPLASSPM